MTRRALLAVAAATWLAACWTTVGSRGGPERVCGVAASQPIGEAMCSRITEFARAQLDLEQPEHAAIRDIEVHSDPAVFKNGGVYGSSVVVVIRLEDARAATYRVHCGSDPNEAPCRLAR